MKKRLRKYKKLFIGMLILVVLIITTLVYYSGRVSTVIDNAVKITPYSPGLVKNIDHNLETTVYFNQKFNDDSILTNTLTNAVRGAKKSIELAMYSFDYRPLADELYRASARGVKVTLILSPDNKSQHDIIFEKAPKEIEFINFEKSKSYMHDKFAIIDRGQESARLLTGSLNWTALQAKFDPSFLLDTKDIDLIEQYGNEFNRLKTGKRGIDKFMMDDYNPFGALFKYKDGFLETWWSPGRGDNVIQQRIIDSILSAKKSIEILIWQMSDINIAKAIIKKANEGVEIKIITDDFNIWEKDSVFYYIVKQKLKNKLDNLEIIDDVARNIDFKNEIKSHLPYGVTGIKSFLHQRTLMVDNSTVLFGTNNWSGQGSFSNDESIMVSDNKNIVDSFKKSFVWNYDSLRKKTIKINRTGNNITIPEIKDIKNASKLVAVSESIKNQGEANVCKEFILSSNSLEFNLPNDCFLMPLNIFVLDKENNVLGSNYIFLESTKQE